MTIGIDAGGTSVRLLLARDGQAVAEARGSSSADGGPAPLALLLADALAQADVPANEVASVSASEVASVCAGITKFTRAGVAPLWEAELARLFPRAARRLVVPDYVIAFHGAIATGAGIGVVAGTGSVVYGEDGQSGGAVRVGGRGWEFGDEGSGAHLTADVVRRTLRALDGLAPLTSLTRTVCDHLGTTEPAALAEAARDRAAQNGRGFLVPLALALALHGDDEARNLFVGAAGWLAAYARAALTRLGFDSAAPVAVATMGGLWEAGDLLLEPFGAVLRRTFPYAQIAPASDEPVVGAIRLAEATLP